jgi:hypothetical protein
MLLYNIVAELRQLFDFVRLMRAARQDGASSHVRPAGAEQLSTLGPVNVWEIGGS